MSILRLGTLLSFVVVTGGPIHAQTIQSAPQTAGGACHQTIIQPGPAAPSRLLQHAAFHGDTVVQAAPAPCCRFDCTQMLSTTRLQAATRPGRT